MTSSIDDEAPWLSVHRHVVLGAYYAWDALRTAVQQTQFALENEANRVGGIRPADDADANFREYWPDVRDAQVRFLQQDSTRAAIQAFIIVGFCIFEIALERIARIRKPSCKTPIAESVRTRKWEKLVESVNDPCRTRPIECFPRWEAVRTWKEVRDALTLRNGWWDEKIKQGISAGSLKNSTGLRLDDENCLVLGWEDWGAMQGLLQDCLAWLADCDPMSQWDEESRYPTKRDGN